MAGSENGSHGWDHRPHVTKMISPMTGEIKYLCSLGNPFDVRSKLMRYFSYADSLEAMEWSNEYGAVRVDITGEGDAAKMLANAVDLKELNDD